MAYTTCMIVPPPYDATVRHWIARKLVIFDDVLVSDVLQVYCFIVVVVVVILSLRVKQHVHVRNIHLKTYVNQ